MKVIIIGGVAGGASAAARLRRLDENVEITMFEKGPYISFANCGLPYYISGAISERENLLLQTPEEFNARFNVDVRVNTEVIEIVRDDREVVLAERDPETGKELRSYRESYDKLILSPGSVPLTPPIPGIDGEGIYTLWTVPDVDRVKAHVTEKKPRRAVVVGGGFIGLEVAENLIEAGVAVDLVEMADQVMTPVDYEMAQIAHQHLTEEGVNLFLSNGVKEFKHSGETVTVVLQDGTELKSDMVMLSIGVRPQTDLARKAGLELNQRGGIVVDDQLKTSDENIFAVGDAIQVRRLMDGEPVMIPLAGPANKQGRMVAANVLGGGEGYKGSMGTSIAKVFDLSVASTGLNEKSLKAAGKEWGRDYMHTVTHSKSHAGYYPGAFPMAMKMIFDVKSRRVLGAQIVGYEGVDKRIDVLATAIRMEATIDTLTELELAYAPPYSSAKDPVNMAGFTAENMLAGLLDTVTWDRLKDYPNAVMLDVRDPEEADLGDITDSVLIPVNELRGRLGELDKDKTYITYCAVGLRGYVAARMLKQHGFSVMNLAGGYSTWQAAFWDPRDRDETWTGNENVGGNPGEVADKMNEIHSGKVVTLDACGLSCPGPIKKVYEAMNEMAEGDVLEINVTDPGFKSDIASWCKRTGNTLLDLKKEDKRFTARIRKGSLEHSVAELSCSVSANRGTDKTMVCFSGDLDKALASFIIANGAAAMGRKVTMFFTFWGLNVIRRHEKVAVKKNFISRMFGMMMPRGARRLKLSQMNMAGAGAGMIKGLMKKYRVPQLQELIEQAREAGVKLIACNMSMELMGIQEDELIDGVELGGVAAYLDAAEDSGVNLFI